MIESLLQFIPTYVLVFFRVTGMMLFAPLFGSAMIPRRVKVLIAAILAMAVAPSILKPTVFPPTTWELALGIGGEMAFGIVMGMIASLVFIAAQWAGEMMGQQMGINLGEVFDPQFGGHGSLVGGLYYMLTLVVFISPPVRGDYAMLRGLRASFDALPLLSVSVDASVFDMLIGLLQASTTLAFQLAAPMIVTMLVVDLSLGFIGKTMPQLNIMTMGLSLRAALGMVVLVAGLVLTMKVISAAMMQANETTGIGWTMGR